MATAAWWENFMVPIAFLVGTVICVLTIAISNAKIIDEMRADIKLLKHHINNLHELIRRERRHRTQVSFIRDDVQETKK